MVLNSNQENDTSERSMKGSGLFSLSPSMATARSSELSQVTPSPKEILKTKSPNAIESIRFSNLWKSRSVGGGGGTPTNAMIHCGQQPQKMAIETAKPSESSEPSPTDPNNWVAVAKKLISFLRVKVLNGGTAFDYPVDGNIYRDYYQLIKKPMYFNKIIEKLENGEYEYPNAFYDDVLLICDNCYKFNVLTYPSDFGLAGVNLENAFLKAWAKTPMAAEVPPRPLRDIPHIPKPQPATSGYRRTSSGGGVSRNRSKPQERHVVQARAVDELRKSGSQLACDTKPDGNRTSTALGIEPERKKARKRCDGKNDSNAKRSRPNGKDSALSQSAIRCSSKDMVCPGVQPSSSSTQPTTARWSDEKRTSDFQEIQKEMDVPFTQITSSGKLNSSIEGSSFFCCKQCKEKFANYKERLYRVITENQSLREKNADLEKQNQVLNDMENQAIAFYSEKEDLLERLNQIREEHEREKDDLQKLLTVTTEENIRLVKTKEDEIRRLELCNINTKREKEDLEATKDALQLTLNDALTQASILARERIPENELLSEIETLKNELEKKKEDNCSLNNEIEKLQGEIEEKENDFGEKEKQNEELANENTVLKKDIEILESDFEKKIKEMGTQNDYLQAKNRESTLEIEKLKEEKDRIAEKIQELEKQKEEVSIQRNVFQEKHLELEAKLEMIEKEKEKEKKELQNSLVEAQEQCSHLEKELQTTKNKIKNSMLQQKKMEEEKKELGNHLSQYKLRIEELQEKYSKEQQVNNELRRRADQIRDILSINLTNE